MNKTETVLKNILDLEENVSNLHTFITTEATRNKGKFTSDPGKPIAKHSDLRNAKRMANDVDNLHDEDSDNSDNDNNAGHHIHNVSRIGEDRYKINSSHTKINNNWVEHSAYKGKHITGKVDSSLDFTHDSED